jgi:hypothetical protein
MTPQTTLRLNEKPDQAISLFKGQITIEGTENVQERTYSSKTFRDY